MSTFLFYLGVMIFGAGAVGNLLGWPKQLTALSLMCAGNGIITISIYLTNQHGEDHEEVG